MAKSLIGILPIKDWVLIDIYDDGESFYAIETDRGTFKLWMPPDSTFGENSMKRGWDTTHPGIRGRWAMVIATTDKAEEDGIRVGQKVFCEKLKWTRPFEYDKKSHLKVWGISREDIILIDLEGFTEDEELELARRYSDLE